MMVYLCDSQKLICHRQLIQEAPLFFCFIFMLLIKFCDFVESFSKSLESVISGNELLGDLNHSIVALYN